MNRYNEIGRTTLSHEKYGDVAWNIFECVDCGAMVTSPPKHDGWHADNEGPSPEWIDGMVSGRLKPLSADSAASDTWPCDTCERDIDKKYGWCPFCSPEKASIQACPLCHADPETRDDCKRCDGDGFIDVGVVAGERATARPEDAPHPDVGGGASAPLAASGEKCEVCDETGGKGTIWVYDKLNVEENGRWEPCPECGSVNTERTAEKPLRDHVEAFMTAAEGKRVPAPSPINSADGTLRIGGAAEGQRFLTALPNVALTAGGASFPEPSAGMTWGDMADFQARANCPACAGLTAHHCTLCDGKLVIKGLPLRVECRTCLKWWSLILGECRTMTFEKG